MQMTLYVAGLLATCSLGAKCPAQSAATQVDRKATSLCVLQKQVAEGKHETVRVSGVYGPGPDHTVLEEASCPDEGTWVELELRSNQNKVKLRKMLDHSRQVYVEVEGEFYGPPLPDPKLPEVIKKDYHPGWGHLAAFKTKLVVHVILNVKPAPGPTTQRPRCTIARPNMAGGADMTRWVPDPLIYKGLGLELTSSASVMGVPRPKGTEGRVAQTSVRV